MTYKPELHLARTMTMMPVSVRLDDDVRAALDEEARSRGVGLSTYLRQLATETAHRLRRERMIPMPPSTPMRGGVRKRSEWRLYPCPRRAAPSAMAKSSRLPT